MSGDPITLPNGRRYSTKESPRTGLVEFWAWEDTAIGIYNVRAISKLSLFGERCTPKSNVERN